MKGHITKSTAALFAVIALLVGALVVTVSSPNRIPVLADTSRATETGPITSFAPVVKRAMPAVVNISSSKVVKEQQGEEGQGGQGLFNDPFFRQFFGGRLPQGQVQPRSQRATSLGSGVVVTPDGYILTNNHVVEGATDVKVAFSNKEEYPAKIVGADKYSDIAVLKIDKSGLATLPFADSNRAEVGDVVLAIGEPFGLPGSQTVTMGIISAKGRAGLGIERFEDFIQTDAAINRGNSGGALIDTRGDLVGINTAILSGESGGNQGIGFAIPANMAKSVMDQIMSKGKVTRGFLGIIPQELTPEMAKALDIPNARGVAITQVEPNSPAAKAGLKVGDVITAVNGNPADDVNSFRLQVAGFAPNTTINLKVERNGQALTVPVTLGEFNLEAENKGDREGNLPGGGEKGALKGLSVQALTPDLRQELQTPEGTQGVVITDVDPDSAASAAGLHQGDIVVQVDRKPVTSVSEFNAAVKAGASRESTLLLVKRGQGTQFVVVPNK
jgi:serine protease Do